MQSRMPQMRFELSTEWNKQNMGSIEYAEYAENGMRR